MSVLLLLAARIISGEEKAKAKIGTKQRTWLERPSDLRTIFTPSLDKLELSVVWKARPRCWLMEKDLESNLLLLHCHSQPKKFFNGSVETWPWMSCNCRTSIAFHSSFSSQIAKFTEQIYVHLLCRPRSLFADNFCRQQKTFPALSPHSFGSVLAAANLHKFHSHVTLADSQQIKRNAQHEIFMTISLKQWR